MTTPDAEDASPSPEYSGDQDDTDMAAEQKIDRASSDASPNHAAANKANAKDPLRPRRKKARRACFACQRAHLTCGDERPCHRCIKRGLQEHCMDGVRKKAKYLHDAPDGALMPGVGGAYPHLNGQHQAPLQGQETGAVAIAQPGNYYTQAPTGTYYPGPQPVQDPSVGNYNPQPPISPPYTQPNQPPVGNVPSTVAQGAQQVQQFGGPLFDPSDPALFNFDISSLNFGNHYGALELGMLGHMSSGAADTPPSDNNLMNQMNQAPGSYQPQMSAAYSDGPMTANIAFAPDSMPNPEWHAAHSRHGSIQMQTPSNTPTTATLDSGGHRHDSLNGPHAYAIGQGPSSLSSASPASNAGYDNDNPLSTATFFANSNQHQHQHQHQPQPQPQPQHQMPRGSPNTARLPDQARLPSMVLQPIQTNAMRRRRRDTSYIYNGIKKPYDYTAAFHRLSHTVGTHFTKPKVDRIRIAIGKYRPLLISSAGELDANDLTHSEQNLQRQLLTLEDMIAETGTPMLILRRSGEVALMGKEFSILTGWKREVLLGKEPNLNVNRGSPSDTANNSGNSSQSNTTPVLTGRESDSGPYAVSICDLMDEDSVAQFYEDFAELAYDNSRGTKVRRVKMLKYRTKEDMIKLEELKVKTASTNGSKSIKADQAIKMEHSVHGEAGISMLGARDGMVDCMICWHIKRDTFEMPMLAVMNILPVLA